MFTYNDPDGKRNYIMSAKNHTDTIHISKPVKRSALRNRLGLTYYSFLRHMLWLTMNRQFAKDRQLKELPFIYFTHKTPLLRKLKDVDMWMQYNKITNLKLAVGKVNRIILRPGEVFSYWKLIG